MDVIIRGSEYQSFLNCRKQWFHQWVEEIEPKRPDNKLFIGNAFHKWLEVFYGNEMNSLMADMETTKWIKEQDTSGMEQVEFNELMVLLKGMTKHYIEFYGSEEDAILKVLGTEVEFIVKLDDNVYYTGTIDLVYETPSGKVRGSDHKTVSSIQQYIEKSVMDRQISRYWWVLEKLTEGIAKIKNKETGDWDFWPELFGKDIDGFDYNLIAKDFPREPTELKKGGLSVAKNQKTDYHTYLKKLKELNLPVEEYTEFLQFLKDKPEQFLHRVDVKRTKQELDAAMWEFMYTAGDVHDIKLTVTENPLLAQQLTYRNIGNHCMNMCPFKTLCQTAIEGGNVSLVKNLGYKKREVKK